MHETPEPPATPTIPTPATPASPAWESLLAGPLAHAVSAAGVGLWELDLVTGQEVWSDTMRLMHGLPPGAPAPNRREWRERFVHPEDLGRIAASAEVFERTGRPYEAEYRICRTDGSLRWLVSRSAFRLGDRDRVLGVTLDVSERRVAEQRARDAEVQLGHAARHMGFGFGEREPGGEAGEWSPELKRLWGLPPDGPTPGRSELLPLIVPQDRARVAAALAKPIPPGALSEFSFDVLRGQDGGRRTLTTRAFTEYDAEGRRRRTFFVVHDTTELMARERELAELLEQRQMAAEAAGIGSWDRDLVAGVDRWSPECARILGVPEGAPPLTREAHLAQVHPDDRALVAATWRAADTDRTPLDFEYRIVRGDGAVRWLRTRGRVERDADGRSLRRLGVLFDVTERHERDLAQRERLLAEQANAAKTEFLSRMSHELRTPLNAVIGFAQLMLLDGTDPLSAAQRERLLHVQRAGWHLLALVNDVLDLSRIEAREAPMKPAAVPLAAAVADAIAMAAPKAAEAGVALRWEPSAVVPPVVWADPTRLHQLLLNLLSNGAKYNRRGGWVRVSAREAGEQVVIAVRDNGLGIAADRLPRLFQPFDRLGREGSGIEGTGLGLALVKGLVEQMGGCVEVDSVDGEGSEFRLLLPRPPAATGMP